MLCKMVSRCCSEAMKSAVDSTSPSMALSVITDRVRIPSMVLPVSGFMMCRRVGESFPDVVRQLSCRVTD